MLVSCVLLSGFVVAPLMTLRVGFAGLRVYLLCVCDVCELQFLFVFVFCVSVYDYVRMRSCLFVSLQLFVI